MNRFDDPEVLNGTKRNTTKTATSDANTIAVLAAVTGKPHILIHGRFYENPKLAKQVYYEFFIMKNIIPIA